MPFSVTQYETAVNKVAAGAAELRDLLPRISAAASAAVSQQWYLPVFIKDAIRWCADQMTALLKGLGDSILDLLQGVVAPVRFWFDASTWQEVRGQASVVSGTLKDTPLSIDDLWSGPARNAYVAMIPRHSEASDRISRIATRTAQALYTCSYAGLGFYVALGFILVKLIIAASAAIAAFGSGVFSWAGAAIIFEEAGINTGLILILLTTLAAVIGAQANEMIALQGESVDATGFPRRRWPGPAASAYSDATVMDGDADWSLRRR